MSWTVDTGGRRYWTGEKPPPLAFEIRKRDGSLDTSVVGTITAQWANGTTSGSFACTNNGDGTGTIDWPTAASIFTEVGTIVVDLRVQSGSLDYYLPRAIFPVDQR